MTVLYRLQHINHVLSDAKQEENICAAFEGSMTEPRLVRTIVYPHELTQTVREANLIVIFPDLGRFRKWHSLPIQSP